MSASPPDHDSVPHTRPHVGAGRAHGSHQHIVQFYETDAFLAETVGGYLATALTAADGAIIIATAAHREAVESELRK